MVWIEIQLFWEPYDRTEGGPQLTLSVLNEHNQYSGLFVVLVGWRIMEPICIVMQQSQFYKHLWLGVIID